MSDFKSSLSLFWQESMAYIGGYAAYAFVVCLIVFGLEYALQSSAMPWFKVAAKAGAVLVATTLFFALCLFVISMKAHLFGHEIVTAVALILLWFVLLYLFNSWLLQQFTLQLGHPRAYGLISVSILLVPFVAGYVFIALLASGFNH